MTYTKSYNVTVDAITTTKNPDSIVYNQGDLNTDALNISLTFNNSAMDLTGATDITIYFQKQDGTINSQNLNSGLSIQSATQGTLLLSFYSDTLSVVGTVIAEIHVSFPNSQVIVFKKFNFTVESSLSGGNQSQNATIVYGIQWVSSVSALPTASATYRFKMYAVEGVSGTSADAIYICKMLSDGTYDWIQTA